MGLRIKRIYKELILLIGLVVLVSFTLHLIPFYYEIQNNVFMAMNIPRFDMFANYSFRKRKPKIWKIVPGDDRIEEQLLLKPKVDPGSPPKRILVAHGVGGWGVQAGKHEFLQQDCPINNCEIVDHPQSGQLYDARIFKENDLNPFLIPIYADETTRHPDQIWIIFALESPLASPEYEGLNHVINWTATYRSDSTLVTPYEKWSPFKNFSGISNKLPKKNYASGKTKMGAIFVSNCPVSNERLVYIEELKKHIEVDVYGSCGKHFCVKSAQNDCFKMLKKEYKFYFAFENANCRHYITEKLFLNALQYDVLPVVMGAHPDDYKRAAPPGSYIHVEDFDSPKDLADYLKKLDADDDEYNKYFRWKNTGRFINTKFWCRICSMLWDPNKPRLSVPDLNQWWRGNNTCIGAKRWKDIT